MYLVLVVCSENKGADQLRSHRAADLGLCFHMQKAGFLMMQLKCHELFTSLTLIKKQ